MPRQTPEAAGREAGHVAHHDALLADGGAVGVGTAASTPSSGALVVHELEQLHDEDRVEEVQADDAARVGGGLGDAGDADASEVFVPSTVLGAVSFWRRWKRACA